jgi:DNA-binding NtrC family response regulator
MLEAIVVAIRIAPAEVTVFIQGEIGCGKSELAKFIHKYGPRKYGPFIKVDCSLIPEATLESELFGCAGDQTEDGGDQMGLVDLAQDGTLLLSEVGWLNSIMQAKLFTLLNEKTFNRVGGRTPVSSNARVITTSSQDMLALVTLKAFRKDLYYTLNVMPIEIKPLRERREDIKPLIESKMSELNDKYHTRKRIGLEAMYYLTNYDWPGNVREIENLLEMLIVISKSDEIMVNDLPASLFKSEKNGDQSPNAALENQLMKGYKTIMDDYEFQVLSALATKVSSIKEMAEILLLEYSTVRKKLRKYNIAIKDA